MDALLYLLLRHSVLLSYGNVARRILVRKGSRRALPRAGARRHPRRDGAGVDADADPRAAEDRPRREHPHARQGAGARGRGARRAAREPEYLETLPVDALERQLRGCIDLFAYRLDAWITSLATRRLGELRAKAPRALVLGAFGWVHDLKASPRATVPAPPGETGEHFAAREPGGFLHAPSLAQASAAAVLRSGYLAHMGEAGSGQLAINLSSSRVRLAESLLDGVRQGQQLGVAARLPLRARPARAAARPLHRGLPADLAARRRVPGAAGARPAAAGIGFPNQRAGGGRRGGAEGRARRRAQPARDGARRHDRPSSSRSRRRASPTGSRSCGCSTAAASGSRRLGVPLGSDRRKLEAELAALDEAVDALGDALTAEGVFQLVRGNPARAAASVDAIAHGEIQPPELHFSETPRPGTALTHRLVALFSGPAPAPAAGVRAARRAAEPKLDAWLAQMVGAPKSVRLRAEFVDEAGKVLRGQGRAARRARACRTSTPSISPRRRRPSCRPTSSGCSSSAAARRARVRPADRARFGSTALRRRLRGRRPEPRRVPRAELRLPPAVLSARTLDAPDFHEDGGAIASAADGAELGKRADRAVATLKAARGHAHEANRRGRRRHSPRRLVDLVFLGIPEAVPARPAGERRHARRAGPHDRGGGDPPPRPGRRARGRLRCEGCDAGRA